MFMEEATSQNDGALAARSQSSSGFYVDDEYDPFEPHRYEEIVQIRQQEKLRMKKLEAMQFKVAVQEHKRSRLEQSERAKALTRLSEPAISPSLGGRGRRIVLPAWMTRHPQGHTFESGDSQPEEIVASQPSVRGPVDGIQCSKQDTILVVDCDSSDKARIQEEAVSIGPLTSFDEVRHGESLVFRVKMAKPEDALNLLGRLRDSSISGLVGPCLAQLE